MNKRFLAAGFVLIVAVLLSTQCAAPSPSVGVAASPAASPTVGAAATPAQPSGALDRVKEKGVLYVGFNLEPPADYVTTDGVFTGIDVEVVRHCATELGIPEILGVQTPWDGLIPGLLARHYDVIAAGMAIVPKREEVVDFSIPFYWNGSNAMVPKGNPKNIHSLQDIADQGLRMGATMGALEYDYCVETLKLGDDCVGYQQYTEMIADLRAGRIDAAVIGDMTNIRYIKEFQPTDLEIADPWEWTLVYEKGIAFHPDDDDLREAFNGCLTEAIQSGFVAGVLEQFEYPGDHAGGRPQ
jgi:polar amino acid transport system substrate-binding protein